MQRQDLFTCVSIGLGAGMAQTIREVERLLLVIDGSPSCVNAVKYTAKMLGHRRGFRIHLFQLLPPLPPELLEFGGSENPRKERQLEAELRHEQQEWIASAQKLANPTLNTSVKLLNRAGISDRNVVREFSYPTEPRYAARTILDQAQADHCGTVILAHKAHSWFRELVGADLAEQILRHAHEISVWIVQ